MQETRAGDEPFGVSNNQRRENPRTCLTFRSGLQEFWENVTFLCFVMQEPPPLRCCIFRVTTNDSSIEDSISSA